MVQPVNVGSAIEVPQGMLHRISNTGTIELIFIEVQTGSYFGEDDIERVEDDFGR
jgi:mannose-6-phosphate isomerase-like protein (cupin superfamily)